MKLRNNEDDFVLSNTSDSSEFGIVHSAKMFSILSSGVYEHKVAAIIRELCCNAYDSHVDAGTPDLPFNVILPNELHQYFEVEDFGIGLDDDDVRNIYTKYGASTKLNSNDVIGALGLGSKTPFAYTSTFTIRARKNGKERFYNAYIGDEGSPCISMIGESITEEQNGVKVTVPVKRNDTNLFINESSAIFSFFKVMPNINREIPLMYDDVWSQIEEKGFATCNQQRRFSFSSLYSNPKLFALMGNVAYPFHFSNIERQIDDPLLRDYIEKQISNQAALIIKFNIGDLDISASRESLSLDDNTIKTLATEVSNVFTSEFAKLKSEVDACENELVAIKYVKETVGSFAMSFFEYKGKTIKEWYNHNYELRNYRFGDFYVGFNYIRKSRRNNSPIFDRSDVASITDHKGEMNIIHMSDGKRSGIIKYPEVLSKRKQRGVFVLESKMTPKRMKAFEARLAGIKINWYLLSDLRKELMERNYESQKKEKSEVQGVFFDYSVHRRFRNVTESELASTHFRLVCPGSTIMDINEVDTYYIDKTDPYGKELITTDGKVFADSGEFIKALDFLLKHGHKRNKPLRVVSRNKSNEARIKKFDIKCVSELFDYKKLQQMDKVIACRVAANKYKHLFRRSPFTSTPYSAHRYGNMSVQGGLLSAIDPELIELKKEIRGFFDHQMRSSIQYVPEWFIVNSKGEYSEKASKVTKKAQDRIEYLVNTRLPMLKIANSNFWRLIDQEGYKFVREYIERNINHQ